MSGKKVKGGTPGWLTCPKCDRRLPRSLSGKHSDSDCGLVYPFLYQGDLHSTLVKATTASKIQNLPFIKCSRLSSSTIFLPDEIIRETGFRTFSWVAVSMDNEEIIVPPVALRIWPTPESISTGSSTSSNTNVMLTSDAFLANKFYISGDSATVKLQYFLETLKPEVTEAVFPIAKSVVLQLNDCDSIDKSTFDPQRFIQSFKNWFRNRLVTRRNQLQVRFYAEVIGFEVKSISTTNSDTDTDSIEKSFNELTLNKSSSKLLYYEITDETEVQLLLDSEITAQDVEKESLVTLDDVGGLNSTIKEICSSINFIFNSNLNVAKGVLLYGHSGTGKSFLIQALCSHFNLYRVTYDEFRQLEVQTNRKRIKASAFSNSLATVFQQAISKAPAVIVIENLDTIAAKKSTTSGVQEISNFAVHLQSLIPSLSSKGSKVIILATATDVDGVDSSLRSPQIFGKEIELPVPSLPEREDILHKILNKIKNNLSASEVKEIAGSTHGFVGADLHGLCTQAAQSAVEKYLDSPKLDKVGDSVEENCFVTMPDLVKCLKNVKPSAIKSILVDVPDVRWNDIGGQTELKFKLKQAIEWPLKHPEAFQRLGITPPKGILMYGPPGCSKTMIAKAIATESGLNFISVKGSELFSKWVGESEKAVRDVFKKARQVSPCVVFFDEIDSLGGERGSTSGSSNVHERVLAQLLVEIDGIEPLKDVTIVAATNRPDIIDQALLRPGRLDRIIYVPLPDAETRKEILKIRFQKMPINPAVDLEKIVETTEGYSGAELTAISHEAAMKALEEDIESKLVEERHFIAALELVKPRISKQQIDFYENYSRSHKKM